MLQVDRVIEQLATIGRDSNSGTSNSNRYKSVKNVLQNFFISMKSLHLMLVLCWCYVQCKKFMFTALFSLFSARSKLPVSDQVNFDFTVEMPVFKHRPPGQFWLSRDRQNWLFPAADCQKWPGGKFWPMPRRTKCAKFCISTTLHWKKLKL